MLVRPTSDIPYSEITPKSVYLNRRKFLESTLLSCVAAGTVCGLLDMISPRVTVLAGTKLAGTVKSPLSTSEARTPYKDVSHYNNFYEFGTNKTDPAEKSKDFKTSPWMISVEGFVNKPQRLDMDSIPPRRVGSGDWAADAGSCSIASSTLPPFVASSTTTGWSSPISASR